MERMIGTVSRGVRAPIIREGDNLAEIVVDSVVKACASEGIEFNDRDIVAVTEAVVARAQGNYATVDNIATDGIIFFHHGGDHQFGSHAVDAGDHYRFFVFGQIDLKKSAESADRGEHFGAAGGSQKGFHIFEQIGGKVNIHPGIFVKFAFGHDQKFQNFLVPS